MFSPRAGGAILLVLLLMATLSVGQQTAVPSEPEPLIEQIKKCVVFLQGTYRVNVNETVNGITRQVPQQRLLDATGFLIRIPEPRIWTRCRFSLPRDK